jgi:UDP-3-O-[3-hydroxymyristoyl] glucosamine N-acyltransferase
MSMKLEKLAEKLECPFEGQPNLEITGIAGIKEAQPGDLTFFFDPRFRDALQMTQASTIILAPGETAPAGAAAIRSASPYLHFARAIVLLAPPSQYSPAVHPTAMIANSARIGTGAHIGPWCSVGEDAIIGERAVLHSFVSIYAGARIGDDFFAHSHVTVREKCRVGNRVLLQNGVVVGGDGFAFAPRPGGAYEKLWPTGVVIIGDDVEIQTNSSVDRPTTGETRVDNGCKIDSLVHIGHSCHVGENTVLCAQVGLGGSVEVGRNCILAGKVGVIDHVKVGDGSTLTAGTGLSEDAPAGSFLSGGPAVSNLQWRKNVKAWNYLPDLIKKVRKLRADVDDLLAAKTDGKADAPPSGSRPALPR